MGGEGTEKALYSAWPFKRESREDLRYKVSYDDDGRCEVVIECQ